MSFQIEIYEPGNVPFIAQIDDENSLNRFSPSLQKVNDSSRSMRAASLTSSASSSFKCRESLETRHSSGQDVFLLNEIFGRKDSTLSNGSFRHHCKRSSSCRSYHHTPYRKGRKVRRNSLPSETRTFSTRSIKYRPESKLGLSSNGNPENKRSSLRRSHSRRSTREQCTSQLSLEQRGKMKRRITVWVIVGTFLFILLCSVMAVIITLTHRSEIIRENETMTYYTFSPDAKVIYLGNRDLLVRKENEELMNSLHREPSGHHNSLNTTPAQPQA